MGRRNSHRLAIRTSPARTEPEQNRALATTPVEELPALPMLQADKVTDPLEADAYQPSKRANSLGVMAEAVRWAGAEHGSIPSAPASISPLK